MKKLLTIVLIVSLTISCRKSGSLTNPQNSADYISLVKHSLKDSLSANDYASLDFSHAIRCSVDSLNIYLLRVPLAGKAITGDFLLVKTDVSGQVLKGKFISITKDSKAKASFNGSITYRSLHAGAVRSFNIAKGHIIRLPTIRLNMMETEDPDIEIDGGDLPDVMVVGYISGGGGISYADWYSLMGMLDEGGGYYSPADVGAYAGGGTGSVPTIRIDVDQPENVPAIDVKKYLNCFGSTQSPDATYTVTIATDIPVDGDPSRLFNWSDASPGHTYIELYKNDDASSGLIQQNIGFYPNSSWKVTSGGDVSSKIGDDAGHEYNARYTISVTASQFQSALNTVQGLSTHNYNIAAFNCTDFALAVFNAAGGNLSIPQYQIPGYPNGTTGSNTPQGVYQQLSAMAINGTPNIQTNGNKAYGGTSHGPCN